MLSISGGSAVCRRRSGIVAILAATAAMASTPAGAARLNALVWCDHADPALLGPFEDANGVTVNVKEYEGTGAGPRHRRAVPARRLGRDGGDSIDVAAASRGLFEPLPEDQLPLADLYPQVRLDQFTMADGKRYGITEKFGYNTIGFNKDEVDVADMQTLASCPIRNTRAGLPSTIITCR